MPTSATFAIAQATCWPYMAVNLVPPYSVGVSCTGVHHLPSQLSRAALLPAPLLRYIFLHAAGVHHAAAVLSKEGTGVLSSLHAA